MDRKLICYQIPVEILTGICLFVLSFLSRNTCLEAEPLNITLLYNIAVASTRFFTCHLCQVIRISVFRACVACKLINQTFLIQC